MGLQIEDGTGSGYKAQVTSEGKLRVYAVSESEQVHTNEEEKQAYSIIVSKTPTGANDCFLYLKNDNSEDLIISCIKIRAASAESIQIKIGDSGTAVGGSDNSPVNKNAGSGNIADCTCETGVDITGLTGGTVVDHLFVGTANHSYKYEWDSGIMLPQNKILTAYAVTGAVALNVTLCMYFH